MANYNKIDDNVQFKDIAQISLVSGQKISGSKYKVDEDGNIIYNKPVINAIDIDWNNASIGSINDIKTTADLLRLINTNKEKSEANQAAINDIHIPTSIFELEGGTTVLTTDNFESIKEQLTGKSAFEIAKEVAEANEIDFPYATEAEWVASLKGERGRPGVDGNNGLSAYDIAKLHNSSIGSEEEWINSLQGVNGESAYQIAKRTYELLGKEFPYNNETEWMSAIINGNEAGVDALEEINQINQKIDNIFGEYNENIKNIIDEEIQSQLIPENALEALDTVQELADWIQSHPQEVTTLSTTLQDLKNEWDDNKDTFAKKGELYDGEGQLKTIKGGTNYATTLEEVNDILKLMSFAQDVEDGAEQNWITGINIDEQSIKVKNSPVEFKNEDDETVEDIKLLNAEYNSVNRTLNMSLNADAVECIANKSVDKAVEEAKAYTDEQKVKWTVLE